MIMIRNRKTKVAKEVINEEMAIDKGGISHAATRRIFHPRMFG